MTIRTTPQAIFAAILFLVVPSTESNAQNPSPYCPPNSSSIWIAREFYGDPPGEELLIPFETGTYPDDDPNDGEGELNNYVAGVLEGEIAGSAETQWWEWRKETGQAMAIAARTVAYGGCGERTVAGYPGMDDHSRQHYRPGGVDHRLGH